MGSKKSWKKAYRIDVLSLAVANKSVRNPRIYSRQTKICSVFFFVFTFAPAPRRKLLEFWPKPLARCMVAVLPPPFQYNFASRAIKTSSQVEKKKLQSIFFTSKKKLYISLDKFILAPQEKVTKCLRKVLYEGSYLL